MELYDFYTTKITECDAQIERYFSAIKPRFPPTQPAPTEHKKKNSRSKNEPNSHTRQHLFRITGLDLVAIDGFSNSIAQTVFAEVGVDMSRWPTPKHFCSWLGLSRHNDISGGRILRSKTRKTRNHAAQAFRLAARSVIQSDSALGAFYRRLKARIGPQQALTGCPQGAAHKIARIYYAMCKNRQPFEHIDAETYQQQFHERELKYLRRKGAKPGLFHPPMTLLPLFLLAGPFVAGQQPPPCAPASEERVVGRPVPQLDLATVAPDDLRPTHPPKTG
ncbi:MAG: transposase [Caldilineaceae bacterium]|nr:transposase [Caldilineaceae bacterium]